jgi:DNA-binding CsgD family transcriptional regulator
MLALKELANKKEIKELQIQIRQRLGDFYFSVTRNYGLGFDNYLASYQFLKNASGKEVENKQGMLANIGMAYYQFGDYANAGKFLNEARKACPVNWQNLQRMDRIQSINIVNTLGLIYLQEKKTDSAVYYFRQCYRMAEQTQDSTWMGIVAGNIGNIFYEQQKYREAVPLLELDIRQSIKNGEVGSALSSLLILAQINFRNNDLAKTESLIREARKLLPNATKPNQQLKEFYLLQAKLNARKGNHALAFLFSDSAHVIKDSLFSKREDRLALSAERKLKLGKQQADMQQLEAQKKQQIIIRNSLIGGIFLLIVIGFLVINRQKILHRQKQQKLEAEKDHFASELQTASQQLAEFTNSILEKNNLLEKYAAEIENHTLRGSKVPPEIREEAHDKLLQATILTDDQWKAFRQLFDKVHSGYLLRLHEKLPDLTPAETRYVVLSKLNLTSKDMAAMLGVRPDTIRLYRHRLRKKLSIEADNALEELIHNI